MPNPTWPNTLPLPIADNTASYAGPSNSVRTEMDAGIAKVRRRFTKVAEPFSCTLKLNTAQWAALEDFYDTTLQAVLPFDWKDFRRNTTATYRFIKKPDAQFIQNSVDRWLVTLQLEKLP